MSDPKFGGAELAEPAAASAIRRVSPLKIGNIVSSTPVILAPMAGVTTPPFRRLCREFAELGWLRTDGSLRASSLAPELRLSKTPSVAGAATQSAIKAQPSSVEKNLTTNIGLYVAEMVTSRAVVERNPRALRIINFDNDEYPRSAQVYGVDPQTVGAAVAIIAGEDRADHIDLNFGCPVPKVTRKGGGGALPWKTDLFTAIVRAAVQAAAPFNVPVTIKMRIGIDDSHITYLAAGRIAVAEGVKAITLHARTVAERYSGAAHWEAIATLKQEVTEIPVLGNGDIFAGANASQMLKETNCDGVVVGRGALGRPWLFAELVAALGGTPDFEVRPSLPEVAAIILRHGELLTSYFGDEALACRDLRKHTAWYLRGFPVGGEARRELALVENLAELETKLSKLPDAPYPEAADGPRGRAGSAKTPHLPYGWLDSPELDAAQRAQLQSAELDADGG